MRISTRIISLLVLSTLGFISGSVVAAEAATGATKDQPEKPNVIIIVADQMRRSAMGFWGKPEFQGKLNGVNDPVATPNIDDLAQQGLVFNQAISNFPLCSPFRGMLMSGMYPNNNGVSNNTRKTRPDVGLKPEVEAITDVLFKQGYNTALFGKAHWHKNRPLFDQNGNYKGTEQAPGGYFVKESNFDTYIPPGEDRHSIEYWYQNIGHRHKNPLIYSNDPYAVAGKKDGEPHRNGIYSTVAQADLIVDYLKNNRNQRDDNKPFSILWSMDPPHNPYDSLDDTDEEIFNKYYKDPAIAQLLNRPNVDVATAEKFVRYYFSMVTLIDREVGKVINTLEKQGLKDNTLIVFTADHGEMMGSHGKLHKNIVLEESLAIPLIVHYPKKIAPRVDDLMISVPDFMPTFLGLLGLSQYTPQNIDGFDYSELFIDENNSTVKRPSSSLYYGQQGQLGVRTAQYTYAIDNQGNLIALYDNQVDPYQTKQLKLEQLAKQDSQLLKTELGCWLAHINHSWVSEQKYPDKVIYPKDSKTCH